MEPHICTESACGRRGRRGGEGGGRDGGERGQGKVGDHVVGETDSGSCVGTDGLVYHPDASSSSVACEKCQ